MSKPTTAQDGADVEALGDALERAMDLKVFNFGDSFAYMIEHLVNRRPTQVLINEVEARIALHTSTIAYTHNNPHTGERRGGQGYI